MSAVSDRISQSSLGRLRLRMRAVLRPVGGYNQARQDQGERHAGGNSTVQGKPIQSRDSWFAERASLGTPLSDEELRHGVNAGIIHSALLM